MRRTGILFEPIAFKPFSTTTYYRKAQEGEKVPPVQISFKKNKEHPTGITSTTSRAISAPTKIAFHVKRAKVSLHAHFAKTAFRVLCKICTLCKLYNTSTLSMLGQRGTSWKFSKTASFRLEICTCLYMAITEQASTDFPGRHFNLGGRHSEV